MEEGEEELHFGRMRGKKRRRWRRELRFVKEMRERRRGYGKEELVRIWRKKEK